LVTHRDTKRLPVVLFMVLVAIVACSPGAEPTPTPAAPGGDEPPVAGQAAVESIEILILESFPVQVHVVARGNLPDGCTSIDQITEERDGETFRVTITTTRPADQMCTQALVPFEETIALDVYGLPAGTYAVDVNGATDTFTLDIDNVPPEGSTP
jgi:inhibitor of cysteine peptidase